MKENVGKLDRAIRSVAGPGLIFLGYSRLGGQEGRPVGLLAMLAGVGLIESAITRVCPMSALLGIDTRSDREVIQDMEELLGPGISGLEDDQEVVGVVELCD
jgi:hypothetical protein